MSSSTKNLNVFAYNLRLLLSVLWSTSEMEHYTLYSALIGRWSREGNRVPFWMHKGFHHQGDLIRHSGVAQQGRYLDI